MTPVAAHAALIDRIIREEREALLDEAVGVRLALLCDDAVAASRAARLRRVPEALEAMRWARMRWARGWAR